MSKITSITSVLVLSGAMLGSSFMTSSWAMDGYESDESNYQTVQRSSIPGISVEDLHAMDRLDAIETVRVRRTEKTIMRSKMPRYSVEDLAEMDMLDQVETITVPVPPKKR